jgi:hypothetical protein
MWFKPLLFGILFIFCSFALMAQISGGRTAYAFLRLPVSARIAGLGGNLITVMDDDINLAAANPALLNPAMHQQISFNYGLIAGGVDNGYVAFGQKIGNKGTTMQGGIQYTHYGDLQQTNEFFQTLGVFKANEYALSAGIAHPVYDRLQLGANLKLISSQLGAYNSFGLAGDFAAVYRDTAKRLTFSMVMRNVGMQLSTYSPGLSREPLPFDFQIGFSKRLKHLPFRFSLIYENLQRWNVLYDDPNKETGTIFLSDKTSKKSQIGLFADNLFRHFVFNGELLVGARDNFRLRLGYNHRLRQELLVQGFGGLSGFSFGIGLKVNRFRIDISRSTYHLAGGQTQFSISTNFKEFRKQ